MKKFAFLALSMVAFVACASPKTAQAVFTCDSGSTTTTCVVTTSKSMTNGEVITGTGDLTIANGGSLNLATLTNSFGINMLGTTTIQSGGSITGNFNATTTNFNINFGGSININGKGYAGGGTNTAGSGPGGGGTASAACGAGYVSYGGRANSLICSGGGIYGSVIAPTDFGSGGGGNGVGSGGAGGGAVKIVATGTMTLNGAITANGSVGGGGATTGGGAGGSVWIQTNILTGTGSTTANGGSGGNANAGSASGGRIAMTFNSDTSNLILQTYGGSTGFEKAGAGTIYYGGSLIITNNNVIALPSILSASSYTFSSTTIKDQGILTLASPSTVFNGGVLNITSGTSTLNIASTTLVQPTFTSLSIASGATLTHSAATSSIQVYSLILNITGNASISGLINLDSKGFAGGAVNATGTGPGGGGTAAAACGGSYGGSGGTGSSSSCPQPPTYGSSIAPTDFGSGGGGNGLAAGGAGGGALKLTVGGTLTFNSGQITANGGMGLGTTAAGGGSGGSIWLQADTLSGTGSVTANGGSAGSSSGGKGGGGRISIINNIDSPSVTVQANAGSSGFVSTPPAGNGTINRSMIISVSTLTTSAATQVSTSSARLNGAITNDGNASSTVEGFEYGTTTSYGTTAFTTGTFGVGSFFQQVIGLIPNTLYHFRSYATNSAGTGNGSDLTFTTSSITAPTVAAPSLNFIGSYIATASSTISDDGGFFSTVRGFEYGTTTSYGSLSQESGVFSTGQFQLGLSSLLCRTTYHVRAFAKNTAGTSSSTDTTFLTSSCPPDAPTAVVGTAQNGAVSVAFTAPFNGGSPILRYNVTSSPGNFTATGGTSPIVVSGLTNGTPYTFVIVAENDVGPSATSTPSSSVTPITTPLVLAPTSSSVGSYTATASSTITNDGGNSSTVRGFEYGTTTSYGLIAQESGTFGVGAFQLSLSSLLCRTTYHFRAFAKNTAGTSSSTDSTFLTSSCPPDAPTSVVATPQNASASVVFSTPFDGGSTILRYYVISSPGSVVVIGSSSPITVSGLSNGTPYTFRVVAENAIGQSPTSTPSNSVTPIATPTIQTQPVTNISLTTADFNASTTDTGGSTITTRGFEYGADTSYGSLVKEDGTFGAQDYLLSANDLTCSTSYHVRAFAKNAAGTASSSDETFTTTTCPSPPPADNGQPSNSSGSSSGSSGSWGSPSTETTPTPDVVGAGTDQGPDHPVDNTNPDVPSTDTPPTDTPPANNPTINPENNTPDSPLTDATNSNGGGVIRDILSTFVYQPILSATAVISKTVEAVMTNEIVTKATIVVTALSGLSISIPLLFSTPLTASELLFIPIRLWGLLLMGLGIRKRFKPWGTVYDSATKMPVDPAYVVVRDTTGKIVAESLTDMDGRYGFLLEPGTYYISASKSHYVFPSKQLAKENGDEMYQDLYFGTAVEIDNNTIINKNIPLDPLEFDWNEFQKNKQDLMTFHRKNERIKNIISATIFRVGFFITLLAAIYNPTLFNISILALYTVILLVLTFGLKRKALGEIVDGRTKLPLSYSMVRVYTADKETLITTKVADVYGRYYCLVPQGEYIVTIENKNSDGSYSLIYTSPLLAAPNGIINQSFRIR